MSKKVLNIKATLTANDKMFWIVCQVGHKTYKANWKRSGSGSISQTSGYDTCELSADDYIVDILNALESGGWDLMRECEDDTFYMSEINDTQEDGRT